MRMGATRSMRCLFTAMFAATVLTACFPENQTHVPEIDGRVVGAGAGVAGVVVTVTRTVGDCAGAIQRTTTDSQGRFLIHPVREWSVGRIFVSPELSFTLCLDVGRGPQVAWTHKAWGGPAPQAMTCDPDKLPGTIASPACSKRPLR